MFETKLQKERLLARKALERAGRLAFKPITSARWTKISREWDGSFRIQIEHDNIKNVSPAMLRWWFENLAAKTTWNGDDFTGPEISYCHLWQHRDHIAITALSDPPGGTVNRGFSVDAKSLIDEQFNDYKDRIHSVMTTRVRDEREFTFTINAFGTTVGRLIHMYSPEEGGCAFYSETCIGMKVPVLGFLFNWLILPFIYSRKQGEHWIKHNIEESGRTENVLPLFYVHAHGE